MSGNAGSRGSVLLAAIGGVAVGVMLMVGFIAVKKVDLKPRTEVQKPVEPVDLDAPDKIEVWMVAQKIVEQNMKWSSSGEWGGTFADYQDPRKTVSETGHHRYSVRAWVDSRDHVGIKERYDFTCDLEYVGNGQWKCLYLHYDKHKR